MKFHEALITVTILIDSDMTISSESPFLISSQLSIELKVTRACTMHLAVFYHNYWHVHRDKCRECDTMYKRQSRRKIISNKHTIKIIFLSVISHLGVKSYGKSSFVAPFSKAS